MLLKSSCVSLRAVRGVRAGLLEGLFGQVQHKWARVRTAAMGSRDGG